MTFKPRIVQSNNGKEFEYYETIDWFKANNTKYIFTLPYSPESIDFIFEL